VSNGPVTSPVEGAGERIEYATAPYVVAGLLLGGAGFSAYSVSENGAGRLLLAVAALGCLVEGVRLMVLRPTVSADDEGVHVGRTTMPWTQITSIGASTTTRKLVRSSTLEIDTGDTLVHVPAYRLGAPTAEVVTALRARRPA